MLKTTGARLSAALLGYFTLVILLLTLNPFYLRLPDEIHFTFRSGLTNLISNIILFLPLGFFYRLTTRRRGAYILGFCLSLSIEVIQLFIPARTPSVVDIIANTLGAGLGAVIYNLLSINTPITKGMVGRLRLETPLMGLAYLMGPLLWANSLAFRSSSHHWVLTFMILLCIAIIFSELFRHWWERVDYRIGLYAAITTGVWCVLGLGPILRFSTQVRIICLGMVLLAGILTVIPRKSTERRFELTTLMRILPVFFLYLIALVLWSPFRPITTWHMTTGFTNFPRETSLQVLNPRIEYLIAFTVLGYMLAEWCGRSELSLAQDFPRLFLSSLGIAFLLEIASGFQVGTGASLVRAGMVVIGASFGGMIYHLLRAHIRFLLGR